MDNKPKSSIVPPAFIEIAIAVGLVVLILLTLNYFNILKISNVLPFLSSLPKQESKVAENTVNKNPIDPRQLRQKIKYIITPDDPLRVNNTQNSEYYQYIESSAAELKKLTRIDLEMAGDNDNGIMFNNGKDYASSEYRGIRVYRNADNNSWALEHKVGTTAKYEFIAKSASATEVKKMVVVISLDGKTLNLISPDLATKTVRLTNSLYDFGHLFKAIVRVAPSSKFTLYSLSYQF